MVLCTRSVGRGADWHGDGRELRAIAPGFGRGMSFVGSTGKGREYTSYRGRRVGSFADNDDDDDDDNDDDATSLLAWLMSGSSWDIRCRPLQVPEMVFPLRLRQDGHVY